MKIAFTGYFNKAKEDCECNIYELLDKHGFIDKDDRSTLSDRVMENAMYWGYEISVQCIFDTETGNVEFVGLNGHPIDKTKKLTNNS